MYNRILVPLDGSDHGAQSIPYARILGKSLEAKVEFYRVFDPQPEFFFPNPSEYLQRHQAALEFREQVLADLESHSSSLRADGVDAIAVFHGPEGGAPEGHEHGHQYGAPAEHIVQEAGSDQDILILMNLSPSQSEARKANSTPGQRPPLYTAFNSHATLPVHL